MIFQQGDIVLVDLNPVRGHEQGNVRPVLVVNSCPLPGGLNVIVPITSKPKTYPLIVELDSRTKTHGNILCFQIRTVDLVHRNARYLEQIPDDLLETCIDYIDRLIEL